MRLKVLIIAAFSLLLGSLCLGRLCLGQQPGKALPFCENRVVPLTAPQINFARVESLSYASRGDWSGSFFLTNLSKKQIVQVFAVFDMINPDDSTYSAFIYTRDGHLDSRKGEYVHRILFPYTIMDSPIEPGQRQEITGGSELRSTQCPLRANLTDLEIEYADQSWERFSSSNWLIEPAPTSQEPVEQAPTDLPIKTRCEIEIDEKGKAVISACRDVGNEQEAWITKIIGRYQFRPALINNKPHRFHSRVIVWADNFQRLSAEEKTPQATTLRIRNLVEALQMKEPTFFVTIDPTNKENTEWEMFWGARVPLSFSSGGRGSK